MESKETKEVKQEKETVKITVVIPFRDKISPAVIYKIGQELDFEKERAEDVVTRGLAEYVLPVG